LSYALAIQEQKIEGEEDKLVVRPSSMAAWRRLKTGTPSPLRAQSSPSM
jgi:hypothetical protein